MGRPKKYSKKPYRQDRVYSWMKGKKRPVARAEIMEQFGLTSESAGQLIQRMRITGVIRKVGGATKQARWEICGKRPFDQRGLAQGSLDALATRQDEWAERLRMANVALGREAPEEFNPRTKARRQPRRSTSTCTLEQVWGSPIRAVPVQTGADD